MTADPHKDTGMRRGEVYFVDLDPVVGREQGGRRPVVVLSIDALIWGGMDWTGWARAA
jgi:hypothetical protein